MNRHFCIISACVLLITACMTVSAQGSHHHHLRAIDKNNTLLSNASAASVYQDEFGIIWIGTMDGLIRHDGINNTVFRPTAGDTTSIFNNNIKKVCGNQNGEVYVICKFAVCLFDMKTERFRTLRKSGIRSICSDGTTLIAATSDTILKLDNGSLQHLATIPDYAGSVNDILYSDDGRLYIGTTKGLFFLDTQLKLNNTLKDANILHIYQDSKKNIWASSRNTGLFCMAADGTTENFRSSSNPNSLCSNYVRCVCEDVYGNYWIGTLKGLNFYNSTTKEIQNLHRIGIDYMSVFHIFRDRQNSLWICSQGGIYIYNQEQDVFTWHNELFSDPRNLVIKDIVEDRQNNCLYLASVDVGIMKYDKKTRSMSPFPVKCHLKSKSIQALCHDNRHNALWVGTRLEGLYRIDDTKGELKAFMHNPLDAHSLADNNVNGICIYNDSLIVATNRGVQILDPESGRCTTIESPRTMGKYIPEIIVDKKGNCWMTVSDGLCRYNLATGESKEYFFDDTTLGTNRINVMHEDSHGRIWFGSTGSGLLLYHDDDSFEIFNTANSGIPNDYVLGIEESAAGYILLTTNNGFSKFDVENRRFHNFDSNDSFPLNGLLSKGLYVDSDNTTYVIGYKNVISFKDDRLVCPKSAKDIWFASLEVNNMKIAVGDDTGILDRSLLYCKSVDIRHNPSVIAITPSVPNFIHRDKIEYKLEGFDDKWIPLMPDTGYKIVYTNLKPKTYTLRIRSIEQHTDKVSASNSLTICIHPEFHETTLAYIIYGILAATIIIVLTWSYIIRLKLRISLEDEKKEKAQIKEMNRQKQQFFTYVSHEIRTPVSLIQSLSENLLQKSNIPPSVYNKVIGIQRNVNHINVLLNDILDFRKMEHSIMENPVFSKIEFVPIIEKLTLIYKEHAACNKINFNFINNCSSDLRLWLNPKYIDKVFFNLLSNAFKFTPAGGSVTITTEEDDNTVTVTISDTGKGIPSKYISSIFSPFFQVPDKGDTYIGTGLGLAIVDNIIKNHSGTIQCKSTEGKGTTFTVILLKGDAHIPLESRQEAENEDKACINDLSESLNGKYMSELVKNRDSNMPLPKILIVEDNDELRKHLAALFAPIYEVSTARDGKDALEKLENLTPDIILSDLMMPNMDGNELCMKVKSNIATCHIPFIILTAKVAEESTLESIQSGADDCIAKPFNSRILISKCNNLVNTRRYLQNKFSKAIGESATILATNEMDRLFIDKAIRIVHENMTNYDFDVVAFAHEMAIGRTKLFSKIKGITGQTPNMFITTIRLKYAISLLTANPELTINEVSYMAGFNYPSYFIKTFKSVYGITPQAFREQHLEQ